METRTIHKVICNVTDQETDIDVWYKEKVWRCYTTEVVSYDDDEGGPEGPLEFDSYDLRDEEHIDTLETEYSCRACGRDEITDIQAHVRRLVRTPPRPVARTHQL